MTNTTEGYLKKAGWSRSRCIDISVYREALLNDGYELNEIVEKFLRNYGGLEVVHLHTLSKSRNDKFHFDAKRATECYFPELVEEYMERVDEKLVVIGQCMTDYMVLMLSHSGKMYAGYDDLLLKLGDTVEDGLVALCEGTGITGVE